MPGDAGEHRFECILVVVRGRKVSLRERAGVEVERAPLKLPGVAKYYAVVRHVAIHLRTRPD